MRSRFALIPAVLAAFAVFFTIAWFVTRAPAAAPVPAAVSVSTLPTPPSVNAPTPADRNVNAAPATTPPPAPPVAPTPAHMTLLGEPLPDALARVTKKGFGLYVTPQNSPVQPERFKGYHVGVDFETTPAEQDIDVPVSAVCDGALALARYASGYGGVAVQRCVLEGRDITVIYGHLKLASVTTKVGTVMKRGDRLGVLGKGYSVETDGERKHLHLGIHVGRTITILGYVQTQAALAGWLDARKYLVP